MNRLGLGADLRADIERYRFYDLREGFRRSRLSTILAHQGLQAIWLYRLAQFVKHGRPTILNRLAHAVYPTLSRINGICNGIWISPDASIGPGCYMPHYGGIIIGARAVLGANCNILNNVTIGGGSPTIGDRVLVAVGAKVLGDVHVGSDVAIGANAVVVKDIEDRAVAVGVPARVVSHRGAFQHVLFFGADKDQARLTAMRDCNEQASGT